MMRLLLAALFVFSVLPAQDCWTSINMPWWRNYIAASGSTSFWDNICTTCNPFNDCFVPVPLVRVDAPTSPLGAIGEQISFVGKPDNVNSWQPAHPQNACPNTDLPLACVSSTVSWFGLVGLATTDFTISAADTGTVPCRVRVDGEVFGMTLFQGSFGNHVYFAPFNIPNDPIWIGVTLYFQGFELFTHNSVARMMCSQAVYGQIQSN